MARKQIAWIQGAWRGDADSTIEWYEHLIETKISERTIVVLPELCHTPYFPIEENAAAFDLALSNDHLLFKRFARLARKVRSVIVFPFFEKRGVGVYHNTVRVFDVDGSTAGMYRKSHIPDDPGFYEKYYFAPGDTGITPIHTTLGRLGVLICWDQWFPEAARLMALAGADLLLYPTAIGWDENEPPSIYRDQLEAWQIAMRGHAVSNAIFTVAVNRVGSEGHLRFWGNSFLAGPTGKIIGQSGDGDAGLVTLFIDTEEMEVQRRAWPFFRDRRVDQYVDLLKRWID